MDNDPPRMDAFGRDRSPDQEYSLSVQQAAELYAEAGHPRTIRAVQKYCALSKLDCHKVETETGEMYLVAPYSVTRHIAYIDEVRTVAPSRGQMRIDASIRPLERQLAALPASARSSIELSRIDATVRDNKDRYVARLEGENDFLRGQMEVKDTQIQELTERARETNILIGGLQKMLSPLLGASEARRTDS